MHISRFDLNLLVVLETIYTQGGITKAAEKLHLTQPAISHALARLREIFDDPLFERQGNKMVPTPLTARMIGPLREALLLAGAVINNTAGFDPSTATRKITIGMRDLMESIVIPPFMQSMAREAPGIEVATVRFNRRSLENELAARVLDIAVDVHLPVSGAVKFCRIGADTLAVIARRNHPVVKGAIDLDSYLAQKHVLVTSRVHGQGFEDIQLHRLGVQRHIALRCQFYFAACRAVATTDMLLTMPESYARVLSQQFGHQVLPFPVPLAPLDAYMYWHASTDEDAASVWLREKIKQSYAARYGDDCSMAEYARADVPHKVVSYTA